MGPVQVQFCVSNGKRRRSLAQSFTYLPAVGCHLSAVAATQLIKQEGWELDHISHNPPGFSPDLAYYESSDLPVHCGPTSQNAPLHHPLPSSVPPFDHTSSSIPSQTSVHHQTLIDLQTPIMTSDTFTVHPSSSTLPLQTPPMLPQTPVGPQGEQSPCLNPSRAFVMPTDAQKNILSTSPGQMLSIKQEPEDCSSGLQEITLDDGRQLECVRSLTNLL